MANNNPPKLTKTCSSCGEEKALSAFLQMSGTQHGTAYGNICATCRRTAKETVEKRKKTDVEGGSSSETGHRIDSKTKVHEDINTAEQHQDDEEAYHKERDLDEIEREEKEEEKTEKQLEERHHREQFLKKDKKEDSPAARKAAQMRAGQETVSAEERRNQKAGAQAHGKHEEHKKTAHDFKVTFHGQQIAGQIRFQGQYFQQFKQWLGNSAPVVRNLSETARTASAKKAGAIAQDYAKVKESGKAAQHKEKAQPGSIKQGSHALSSGGLMSEKKGSQGQQKDMATEFVEKNWRPGGGSKR